MALVTLNFAVRAVRNLKVRISHSSIAAKIGKSLWKRINFVPPLYVYGRLHTPWNGLGDMRCTSLFFARLLGFWVVVCCLVVDMLPNATSITERAQSLPICGTSPSNFPSDKRGHRAPHSYGYTHTSAGGRSLTRTRTTQDHGASCSWSLNEAESSVPHIVKNGTSFGGRSRPGSGSLERLRCGGAQQTFSFIDKARTL